MHVRRALALTVIAPLVLAGCSDGDPEAEPTPKMPETSSSSPTPTESETVEAESAEDFIRRWAATEAKMENTGETAEYRQLSADCEACVDLADLVEKWYAAGGFIEWDGWRVLEIKESSSRSSDFMVRVRSSPTRYKESARGPVKTFDGGPGAHRLVLRREGASWVVTHKSEVSQ
ncbi:hypothetical protein KDN32_02275 [Nocardioides sp. J2M5]|uniref:hypothetical protein n=1 Tax=Nocardioides palaemonis TaxID=2829810 RepID=UPI001BA77F86|nr:hypothetical protein [Nocardioides palaemonis]MBS2936565.1 hypothetical protein [Nocardioides palaemonis]